jgi:hypothetical protein
VILGLSMRSGGNGPGIPGASGWALLDERRGEFVGLGSLPVQTGAIQSRLDRAAIIANRAAGCAAIAVERGSNGLRTIAGLCEGSPRIIEIAHARWAEATMPTVSPTERRRIALILGCAEHLLRAHPAAHTQLLKLEPHRRPAAAAAALIALGVALTTSDIRARVLTEQNAPDEAPAPRADKYEMQARLEHAAARGTDSYERDVRSRAAQLRRASAPVDSAPHSAAKPAVPKTAPGLTSTERLDVIKAKAAIARLEVEPGSPRYEQLVAEVVESRRRRRAAEQAGASP